MAIQRQMEQDPPVFSVMVERAGGERREKMAKFLSYEDRLEIQNGLKEHLTFTEIGKRLGRDRTTIMLSVKLRGGTSVRLKAG